MRILFLTDLHGAHGYLAPLIEREREVDLVLLGGDLTSFGSAPHAKAMIDPLLKSFPVVRSVHGNVDQPGVLPWLEERGLSLHGRGETIDGVGFFGCGGSNFTPMRTPTEYSEATIDDLLEQGLDCVRHAEPKVLVCHCPPRDTALDRMFAGKNVGSTSLRAFLQREPVTLCLCGHIHEAVGTERVGDAFVVNPGSFCTGRYALIHLEGKDVRADLRRLPLGRRQQLRTTAQVWSAKIVGFTRHRLGS
jgi:hypothetical protein